MDEIIQEGYLEALKGLEELTSNEILESSELVNIESVLAFNTFNTFINASSSSTESPILKDVKLKRE